MKDEKVCAECGEPLVWVGSILSGSLECPSCAILDMEFGCSGAIGFDPCADADAIVSQYPEKAEVQHAQPAPGTPVDPNWKPRKVPCTPDDIYDPERDGKYTPRSRFQPAYQSPKRAAEFRNHVAHNVADACAMAKAFSLHVVLLCEDIDDAANYQHIFSGLYGQLHVVCTDIPTLFLPERTIVISAIDEETANIDALELLWSWMEEHLITGVKGH